MKTTPETWTIHEIVTEADNGALTANPEYQRGLVWTNYQKQMLIDSLMRDYHLPVFYFEKKETESSRSKTIRYEIIDGQQRVNSITEFSKASFDLLDPTEEHSRFAPSLRQEHCPWANSSYDQLPDDMRNRLLGRKVSVAVITDAEPNEARDLFVRLQQGSDLRAQERRDALPGEFGHEVQNLAGRLGIARGHRFFLEVMKMKPDTDRGRARQFVAQLIATHFEWSDTGRFIDLTKATIDRHYYDYMELRGRLNEVRQLERVLDDAYDSLRGWKGRRLPNRLALHLSVMWRELESDYTNSWKSTIHDTVKEFLHELSEASSLYKAGNVNEFFNGYSVHASGSGSDSRDSITRGYRFFKAWMLRKLEATPKFSRARLDDDERNLVRATTGGKCAYADDATICGDSREIDFYEGEVHHVLPVSQGGGNTFDNLVWVHAECNRKIGDQYIPTPGS